MKLSREKLKQLVREELQEASWVERPGQPYDWSNRYGSNDPARGSTLITQDNPNDPRTQLDQSTSQQRKEEIFRNMQASVGNDGSYERPLAAYPAFKSDLQDGFLFALPGELGKTARNNFISNLENKFSEQEMNTIDTQQYFNPQTRQFETQASSDSLPAIRFKDSSVIKKFIETFRDNLHAAQPNAYGRVSPTYSQPLISPDIALKFSGMEESKKLTHDKLKQIVKEELADILKETIK